MRGEHEPIGHGRGGEKRDKGIVESVGEHVDGIERELDDIEAGLDDPLDAPPQVVAGDAESPLLDKGGEVPGVEQRRADRPGAMRHPVSFSSCRRREIARV